MFLSLNSLFMFYKCITDRNIDEGLRTLFDLFIDDPEKDTITLETFKRICKDVGDNVSDEELKNFRTKQYDNKRNVQ